MTTQLLDWAALAVAILIFAVLWYLKHARKASFGMNVIIATALGIILGIAAQGHTSYVAIVGTIWSQVISAIVVPLLLFSVIASVTNLGESIRLRGIAAKTVILLLTNTLTASLLTLMLASRLHVGSGFQYTLPTDYTARKVPGIIETITGLFPSNLVANWASNQVVPVVLFALLIAIAYNSAAAHDSSREAVKPFKAFVDAGNTVLSKATQIVVGFTPYAVVALIADAISASDLVSLFPLLLVLAVAYIAMALQMFIVQPLILAIATRLNPIPFFKAFWPAGVVAFTSQSSIGTIPVTVKQLRDAGVPSDVASFVASLGSNLGMPGCAGMWPMLLAVFAVNAQGLQYGPWQYAFLVALTLLVSIGTVGVPGTATVTATSLFAAAGLPVAFIALTQPISQIVDMGRTALNVSGAANTAIIVAASERQLNEDAYYAQHAIADDEETEQDEAVDGADVRTAASPVAVAPIAATPFAPSSPVTVNAATATRAGSLANASPFAAPVTNLLGFTPTAVLSDDDICGMK